MYFTYILESEKTGKFYTGSTNDLERRFIEHNSNRSAVMRNRGPFKFVYFEEHPNRIEALRREKYFKTGKGREELQNLMGR